MSSKYCKKDITKSVWTGILIMAVSTSVMLSGCEGKKEQFDKKVIEQQTSSTSTSIKDDKDSKLMEDFKALTAGNASIVEYVGFIDTNISHVTTENADLMVSELEKRQKEYLAELDEKFYKGEKIQSYLSKAFSQSFDINDIYKIEDAEIKELLNKTRDSGYKVETAEGMFFPVLDYEFYKKYSNHVTDDIKAYIDLMAVESDKTPAKDAALVINWEDILKRAIGQEAFIEKYKNSAKINEVRDLYKKYLTFALFGANNTPLFSYDLKKMVPDAQKAYMDALENSSQNEFNKTIKDFMELLKKENFKLTDEVEKFRKAAVEG